LLFDGSCFFLPSPHPVKRVAATVVSRSCFISLEVSILHPSWPPCFLWRLRFRFSSSLCLSGLYRLHWSERALGSINVGCHRCSDPPPTRLGYGRPTNCVPSLSQAPGLRGHRDTTGPGPCDGAFDRDCNTATPRLTPRCLDSHSRRPGDR